MKQNVKARCGVKLHYISKFQAVNPKYLQYERISLLKLRGHVISVLLNSGCGPKQIMQKKQSDLLV